MSEFPSLETLQSLEAQARALEPEAQDRNALRQEAIAYSEEFLESLAQSPAYHWEAENGAGLLSTGPSDIAHSMHAALELIREQVDRPALNPASAGHLAYIPGGGIFTASLGDYLAAISNRYAGVFFASPGAVRMENLLVRWMADLVGYPAGAGGNLSSGGSIANLTAIVTAREAHGLKARDFERSVVYLSEQVHHCVTKALRIAGMGEAILRFIPLDERFRMRPDVLREQVEADLALGLRPWMVVASTGTTDTGSIDPVEQIAEITQAHGLWLHVDAAYGGFFLLTEEGKATILGLEHSDSVVMDPHKGLFLPYGTGAVIVKDARYLQQAHSYEANYMQDAVDGPDEVSPSSLSPELTKHFRGLRMWLPLYLHGLKPFRAALAEKRALALWFYQQLQEIPGMETGPEPELSVVLYRYLPKQGDANAFNEALVQRVHRDGRVFLSSTKVGGIFYLRLAVLCFRTHLATVQLALQVLRENIAALERERAGA